MNRSKYVLGSAVLGAALVAASAAPALAAPADAAPASSSTVEQRSATAPAPRVTAMWRFADTVTLRVSSPVNGVITLTDATDRVQNRALVRPGETKSMSPLVGAAATTVTLTLEAGDGSVSEPLVVDVPAWDANADDGTSGPGGTVVSPGGGTIIDPSTGRPVGSGGGGTVIGPGQGSGSGSGGGTVITPGPGSGSGSGGGTIVTPGHGSSLPDGPIGPLPAGLSPITVDSTVDAGTGLTFSGTATPNARISVVLPGIPGSLSTTADAAGHWTVAGFQDDTFRAGEQFLGNRVSQYALGKYSQTAFSLQVQ